MIQTNTPALQAELNEIKKMISDNFITSKEVLNSKETAKYLGLSYSMLTKLTASSLIPYHKPTNGSLFFFKEELHNWIRGYQVATDEDAQKLLKEHLRKKLRA